MPLRPSVLTHKTHTALRGKIRRSLGIRLRNTGRDNKHRLCAMTKRCVHKHLQIQRIGQAAVGGMADVLVRVVETKGYHQPVTPAKAHLDAAQTFP